MAAKIITVFLFCLFYWFCCFLGTGTDKKNLTGLRSYPDAVQAAVREHPVLGKAVPQQKSTLSILLGNLLLFTIVFSALGLALKNVLCLNDFATAFWFFFALGEGLGLFDLVIIDLVWWRSTKRILFSFLPEKAPYQDPSKHIGSFLRGDPAVCRGGCTDRRGRDGRWVNPPWFLYQQRKYALNKKAPHRGAKTKTLQAP